MSFVRSLERARMVREFKKAKRAAQKVRWPKNADGSKYAGTVMWCPECYRELGRIPDGEAMPPEEQHRLADEHRAVCMRSKLKAV